MKCIALRHVAFEDLGIFGPVLEARGYRIEYRQAGIDVGELRARTVEVRQQAACAGRRMLELWLDGLAAASGTRGPAAVMSADPG
ncbi:MAG: hypothetical protein ACLGII_15180 [Gammaproteobacteria bacterium]